VSIFLCGALLNSLHFGSWVLKLSSKVVKLFRVQRTPERTENAKTPRDAILFPLNFKMFHFLFCFVRKLLGQCYRGNIFPVALPFNSYFAAIPGWTIIAVQYKTRSYRGTGSDTESGDDNLGSLSTMTSLYFGLYTASGRGVHFCT